MADSDGLTVEVTTVVEIGLTAVPRFDTEALTALTRHVLVAEQVSGSWLVAFALVDDDRLQRLHLDFMGIDEPTDVMTFEQDPEDGEPGHRSSGGDIVLSVDRAVEQAVGNGNSSERELLFLATHGLLHLTGWVDHTDEERAAMLGRGEALLTRFETVTSAD